jgi:hypothetical protein
MSERPTIIMHRDTFAQWERILSAITTEHRQLGKDGLTLLSSQVRDDMRAIMKECGIERLPVEINE